MLTQEIDRHVTVDGETLIHNISFEKVKKMSYGSFKKEVLLKQSNLISPDDQEDAYWANVNERTSDATKNPIYATENHMSLFPDDHMYWNLNKFTSEHSLIHDKVRLDHYYCCMWIYLSIKNVIYSTIEVIIE